MYTYFSTFFPQYQRGFCNGYSAQHCLSAMTEKMKEVRDSNKVCVATITDLSKALIVFPTIFLLQNYKPLVLILSP